MFDLQDHSLNEEVAISPHIERRFLKSMRSNAIGNVLYLRIPPPLVRETFPFCRENVLKTCQCTFVLVRMFDVRA